ncbi:hypothetical protein F5X68DRAFT_125952 [Plectosphaerella plurivora]|uniref:C3H1-type domain-containing protein n=1 Tax=Plectosphaerella plurivora TaxID=936078 RepID=A0A9P9AID2_9PEZI|nr:hypothetical protein F5X68DRAFT_125952 [Plectosphaerella plurivora]
MQDWQNNGQPGANQGQGNIWPNGYNFDEDPQFNGMQGWQQNIHGQNAYSQPPIDQAQPVDSGLYGHPQQMQGNLGSGQALNQGQFHAAQNRYPADESYSHATQGQSVPPGAYSQQDAYGQQTSAAPSTPQFTQGHFQYQNQPQGTFNGQISQHPVQSYSSPAPAPYHQASPAAYQQAHFVPQEMQYSQGNPGPQFQPVPPRQLSELNVQQQNFSAPNSQQSPAHATPQTQSTMSENETAEQQAKKRKRVANTNGDQDVVSPGESASATSSISVNPTPFSSDAELAQLAEFKSRTPAAKKAFPAIPGAPFLASTGTVNLPVTKTYDRLPPMIAQPSQSGKRALPGHGHELPCEIQGRFADKYRPSAIPAAKLSDREKEAKVPLDEYERGMKALGPRRPKYADYPFAFSEQLKADEAARSKAQRKAKKEEEEERKKPIRAATRPTDIVEAAVWDMLGIAHIDPSLTRTNTLIADRVRKLGEFLIKLRTEMVKAKSEADQRVKTNDPAAEIAEAKKDLEIRKEIYIRACDAAERYGDDAVLENLGGHQKGVLSMVNALIGCVKASDYSGKLPKSLLRLMSAISMSKKIAEAVNFENVRKRFADKGDDEIKELVRTVVSRIKKDTESTNGTTETKKTPVPLPPSAGLYKATARPGVSKTAADAPSTKRPLDDDTADSRPVKKANVDGSNSSLGSKFAPKPSTASSIASKLQGARPRPPSSSLAAKSRPTVKPGAKPDVSSASKPDSATPMDIDQPAAAKRKLDSARPAPSKTAAIRAAPPKAASSSSALSSIGSLLDSINSKPEVNTAKKDTAKTETIETPEQRAKRLRKESRRRLRVTWKPEPELTQVRIFHKEAAEDENNMTQDAADDRSEGMMLKQRTFTDEDDDEDDEMSGRTWVDPVVADLSSIPQEYRAKAYVTRGGTLTFHTDEQKAMEEREQKELMVIYTDVADIPPTPKSPVPEPAIPNSDVEVGRLPQDGDFYQEMQVRWREVQQHGPDAAAYFAKTRLSAKADPAAKLQSILGGMQPANGEVVPEGYNYNMTPPQKHAQLAQLQAANSNSQVLHVPAADQVLAMIKSDAIKNWRATQPYNSAAPRTQRRYDYPDPAIQAIANALEELFEQFKGQPYPATQPPAWLNDPERIREWLTGYQKDAVARSKREAEEKARAAEAAAAAAQATQANQSSQDAWAAYYQQQAQQKQAQQMQQQAPPVDQSQQDVYAQYMAMFQQMQQGQTQQPAASGHSTQLGDSQVQALLAQINQPQQPAAVQPSNAYNLNPNDQGYQQLMMLTQMQQQQQQPQQQQHAAPGPSSGLHPDREERGRDDRRDSRDRERYDQHDGRRDKHANNGGGNKARKGNAPGGATLPPHRPANKALIGTKPCVFWQQGKCARGDKCTFRHDN